MFKEDVKLNGKKIAEIKPKDLALWETVVSASEHRLEQSMQDLEVQKVFLEAAKTELEKVKSKQL